jgi:hypothetical protein
MKNDKSTSSYKYYPFYKVGSFTTIDCYFCEALRSYLKFSGMFSSVQELIKEMLRFLLRLNMD